MWWPRAIRRKSSSLTVFYERSFASIETSKTSFHYTVSEWEYLLICGFPNRNEFNHFKFKRSLKHSARLHGFWIYVEFANPDIILWTTFGNSMERWKQAFFPYFQNGYFQINNCIKLFSVGIIWKNNIHQIFSLWFVSKFLHEISEILMLLSDNQS